MKTIGLLGGMSWQSTLGYYRAINEIVRETLGSLHSAPMAIYSVDFQPLEQCQQCGDWDAAADILVDAARRVEAAGADFILIGTNTMHKVAPQVEAAVGIPLLHIADATAEVLLAEGVATVGLLGTAYTMEDDFYKGRLTGRHGLQVLTPNADDRATVHRVIYEELCLGQLRDGSRRAFRRIMDGLADDGAEAVILGCTEIGMLVGAADCRVPILDTTRIHAQRAVAVALEQDQHQHQHQGQDPDQDHDLSKES